MNVIIFTQYPFPFGLAQSNRLIGISKGLVHANVNTKVVCMKPTELPGNVRNFNTSGTYKDVGFLYSAGTTIRSKNPLLRLILYYYGFWRAVFNLLTATHMKKPQVVIIGVVSNIRSVLLILACRFRRIKVVHERSEYPFLSYSNSLLQRLSFHIYKKCICKRFDGMITITHALKNYYRPFLKSDAHKFILPILVEPERFATHLKYSKEKYLAYCGSMEGTKDGVGILIRAFHEISSEFPETKLYLIGSTNIKEIDSLKEQISLLQLGKRIVFTGRVEREAMPDYLLSAQALCLARPASKQAEGGFPTKLGEYLCSGRPVVVTKVGEVPDYLTDGENAYLAEPDDVKDFAGKLREVLSNPVKSDKVGENGKKLALHVFNYQTQGIKLAAWLKELI